MVETEYQARAAEMRELAKTGRDPIVNKELLFLAEQYEALAKPAEADESDLPKR